MGILDSLFGKKVTVQFRDESGNLVERKISEAQLNELEKSGAISKTEAVEVHIIDPNGNYSTFWKIGEDISPEIVQKAKDKETGALYALTTYQSGEHQTHVLLKEKWLIAKAQFDAIEQESKDATTEIRKQNPQIFDK